MFEDAYGNGWKWNPNEQEWDVRIRDDDMNCFAEDGGHADMSPEGRVTHG
ncbi:hypothetical protein [Saccharothrix sp. Mg75]